MIHQCKSREFFRNPTRYLPKSGDSLIVTNNGQNAFFVQPINAMYSAGGGGASVSNTATLIPTGGIGGASLNEESKTGK